MKRLTIVFFCLLIILSASAQREVTRFLGYPVDGSEKEMIRKLKSKGFKKNKIGDVRFLSGEFNGNSVEVIICTEKGKVSRIMLRDAVHTDKDRIKHRFNTLCEQFMKNSKYIYLQDYSIPQNEDVAQEILENGKRYEAVFYQIPGGDYGRYQDSIILEVIQQFPLEQIDDRKDEISSIAYSMYLEDVMKRPVWFYISTFGGKFYIVMYYDNEFNRANGEDL